MNNIFDREEYQDFTNILMRVSSINQYSIEQHNNIIDFLGNIDEDTALYIIELLGDFFLAGFDYANMPQRSIK